MLDPNELLVERTDLQIDTQLKELAKQLFEYGNGTPNIFLKGDNEDPFVFPLHENRKQIKYGNRIPNEMEVLKQTMAKN